MLTVLQSFKEWKEKKQRMKREVYSENKEVGNMEKNGFFDFVCMSKTKWKRKKTHGINYYWLHQHANLLVIVASHVSLAIISPWFKSISKHNP